MLKVVKILGIASFIAIGNPFLQAQESTKVVVIGAGLSGLTSAYYLDNEGVDVEVYEARNRVGGRVFTVYQNDHVVELGGQNISDGGDAENILALIEDLELETETSTMKAHLTYLEDGQAIDVNEFIKKQAFNPSELEAKLSKLSETSTNMQEVLDSLLGEDSILNKALSVLIAADMGASMDRLSSSYAEALFDLLQSNSPYGEGQVIEHLTVKGGNGKIAEALAEELSGQVHLNHELKTIAKSSDGSYILTFQNGKEVEADILILTIPCTVFKHISIDDEVISSDRLSKIKSIEYGTGAKIIVPIQQPTDVGSFTNGSAITFFNRDKTGLILYFVDHLSRFTEQTIGAVVQKELPWVEKYFKLSSGANPVVARDQAFSSYTGIVGHSWPEDPFVQGSYSFVGVGQDELFTTLSKVDGEAVKTLFAPIGETLYFAGEHTSILLNAGGTMEAAVESGVRTSRMVAMKLDSSL